MADLALPQSKQGRVQRWLRRPIGWRWRDEAIGVVMVGLITLLLATVLPRLLPQTILVHLDQGRLHVGAGFLLCALALFVLRAPRRAVLALLCGTALLGSIGHFGLQATASFTPNRQPDFSLISFNVLGSNPRGDEVAAFLVQAQPDIALVLEAPALANDLDVMREAFPYNAGCAPGARCDMAVFSQHPLRDVELIPFFTIHGRLIRARLDLEAGPVTLVAAHLTKPYYGDWHAQQMDRLVEVLGSIEGPVVLAGDFNSQPFVTAFQDHLISQGQMQLASKMLPTWPARFGTGLAKIGFAIDHVLVRGGVYPIEVDILDDPLGSNHFGLMSSFDLDGR